MKTQNKSARMVGILFIIGTVAGVLSLFFAGPILDDPGNLIRLSANENQITIGALLVFVMSFALAMIPVVLFPIFRKYNEALALGAVVFRGMLEPVTHMASVISWLLRLALGREFLLAGAPDAAYFQTLGAFLAQATVLMSQNVSIVFSLGALMIYFLFYRTKLVPRWLSIWGLVGAMLYLAEPLLALFGSEYEILFAPLAVQEMVFAVWLIVKGFEESANDPASVS